MKNIFITGTDTGIGKTVLIGSLVTYLRGEGIDAVPMKPVQTGCEEGLEPTSAPDLNFCLRWAGLNPPTDELGWMAPYRLEPECSPHLAAERGGVTIEPESMAEALNQLANRHECVLVEGAGGVQVPLTRSFSMLDLMQLLGLPVFLVARPALGTLNHTLLSLQAIREKGLVVEAVILVESQPVEWGFVEEDNVRTLRELGEVRVVGPLGYQEDLDNKLVRESDLPDEWVPCLLELKQIIIK